MYFFYTSISDCWHLGNWHINKFPIDYLNIDNEVRNDLIGLASRLSKSYVSNRIERFDKRINGNLYEYKISKSKKIIDEIDKILAKHYNFTEEELDFIINYDIKYRMGKELFVDVEE